MRISTNKRLLPLSLVFAFLSFSPYSLAANSVLLLEQDTGLTDYVVNNKGDLLSTLLEAKEDRCVKRYVNKENQLKNCLKTAVSTLKQNKRINFYERSLLIELIKTGENSPAYGASIALLNVDTGIQDHPINNNGKLLSEFLATKETQCAKRKTEKKQRNCLKTAVKNLRSNSRINKVEYNTLINLIKNGVASPEEPAVTTSAVNGRVTTADGVVVEGVVVSTVDGDETLTATTDEQGEFSLALTPNQTFVLSFSGDGLANQVKRVLSPKLASSTRLDVTVIKRFLAGSLLADGQNKLEVDGTGLATGINYSNIFMYASGDKVDQTVTGNMDAYLTSVDLSSSELASLPGETSPIHILGALEVDFTQNGDDIKVWESSVQGVHFFIPLYQTTYQDGSAITLNSTIPVWFLNEATGVWEQKGVGMVASREDSPTGLALKVSALQLGWYSAGMVNQNVAQAIVTVTGNESGTALLKVTSKANLAWQPSATETQLELNTASSALSVPSNAEVCFSAEVTLDDGRLSFTEEKCATPEANGMLEVILEQRQEGALSIVASSSEVTGFTGKPIDRVSILPTTLEDAVSFALAEDSAPLPEGITLNAVSSVSAELSGIPTEQGSFPVTIEATSEEGEVAIVELTLTVDSLAAPLLPSTLQINIDDNRSNLNLNQYNEGGASTNWTMTNFSSNCVFNDAMGTVFFNDSCFMARENNVVIWKNTWTATITASNALGTSSTEITVSSNNVDGALVAQ